MTSHNTKSITSEVYEIGKLHFEGNITPHCWYENIRFENGKVDLVSITILSEIVYWYRPTYIKDEMTGQVISANKKFKGDALQKSKQALADQFGLTERQVKDSLLRLEEKGLITRDYRTLSIVGGAKLSNVLYIKIHPKNIEKISFNERQTYDVSTSDPQRSNETPMTFERHTYTKNTTKISTKNTSIPPNPQGGEADKSAGVGPVSSSSEISSKKKKEEKPVCPKTTYRALVSLTETEYAQLVESYGVAKLNELMDLLEAYKGSSGKTYKSDYHTLLPQGWVNKRYEDDKKKQKSPGVGNANANNFKQSVRDEQMERYIQNNGDPDKNPNIRRF